MQAVLAGPVADEGVVLAAELADHVAQTEDGAEDELGVIVGTRRRSDAGGGGRGGHGRRDGGRWSAGGVGDGRGELGRGKPCFGVDALGWDWGYYC